MKIFCLFLFSIFLFGCQAKKESSIQKISLNLYTEPPTLDSRKATDTTSAHVLTQLFEGLTRLGFDNEPKPAAAEEIQISPDKLTYTFRLFPTNWSNGEPVTAYDFLYSWQTMLQPKFPSPNAYKLFVIKNAYQVKEGKLGIEDLGVKVLDEKTLQVTLEHPTPFFLELVATPPFFPIPRFLAEKNESWANDAETLISNGPFKIKSWKHENEIQMVKNPFYWDSKKVNLEKISMVMVDNSLTEFQLFETKELDWSGSPLTNLPAEILPALKNEGELVTYPVSGIYYYKINTSHPLLKNINIRKALSYAIDREAIVQHILQGSERAATGFVPRVKGWKETKSHFTSQDKAKAIEYFERGLQELHATKEDFSKITLSYNSSREHQKIAEAIQSRWKEILDIDIKLEHFEWKVYLSKIDSQNYDIGRMGWIGDYSDPLTFLEPFKYLDNEFGGFGNNTGWTNSEYTRLLNASNLEKNEKERIALFEKAESILLNEMPIIPLYFIHYKYVKSPKIKNVYLSPLGGVDFKWAYVEESSLP